VTFLQANWMFCCPVYSVKALKALHTLHLVFITINMCVYHLFFCERWEAIANFLKIHITDSNRSAKDVLAKAKQLQKNGKFRW